MKRNYLLPVALVTTIILGCLVGSVKNGFAQNQFSTRVVQGLFGPRTLGQPTMAPMRQIGDGTPVSMSTGQPLGFDRSRGMALSGSSPGWPMGAIGPASLSSPPMWYSGMPVLNPAGGVSATAVGPGGVIYSTQSNAATVAGTSQSAIGASPGVPGATPFGATANVPGQSIPGQNGVNIPGQNAPNVPGMPGQNFPTLPGPNVGPAGNMPPQGVSAANWQGQYAVPGQNAAQLGVQRSQAGPTLQPGQAPGVIGPAATPGQMTTAASSAVPATAAMEFVPRTPAPWSLGFSSQGPSGGPTIVSGRLTARLANTGQIQRRSPISVTLQGDTAVIRGRVATEHDRDLAGALLSLEPGVGEVRNELLVESPPPAAQGASSR